MITWADETALWEYISPGLRGWPRRLEAVVPVGMPDAFTLWNNQTWWIELKLGTPAKSLMEPKQIEFGFECQRRGIPYYICVGHRGRVLWFTNLNFNLLTLPKFYVPKP